MRRRATERLIKEMITIKGCADFVRAGWFSLYLDILTYAGNPEMLAKLDSISIYALLDWYEFQEECEKGE